MVYLPHAKFVVRGQLGDTEEIFSNTLHFPTDVAGGPDTHPEDWDQGAITAAVNAFYGSGIFSSAVHVTGWRGYDINAAGTNSAGQKVIVDYGSPISGGGTHRYPPQVALVVTLLGANDGPGRFGRVFLPIPNRAVLGTTLEMVSGDADSVLSTFHTYVDALLDAMYDVLVSNEALINVSKVDTGTIQDVVELRCGLALDTMRSRRNKLLENYQSLAW